MSAKGTAPIVFLGLGAVALGLILLGSQGTAQAAPVVPPNPNPNPNPNPQPTSDCDAARASYETNYQHALAVLNDYQNGYTTAADACAAVQVFAQESSALTASGCPNPGHTLDDLGTCHPAQACTDLDNIGSTVSALVAEGRVQEACALADKYNVALNAAAQAGCPSNHWGPLGIDCSQPGPGPGPSGKCDPSVVNAYNNLADQVNSLARSGSRCAAYTMAQGLYPLLNPLIPQGCDMSQLHQIDGSLSDADCANGGTGNACAGIDSYNAMVAQVNAAPDRCTAYQLSASLPALYTQLVRQGCADMQSYDGSLSEADCGGYTS